jgi:hypothetical protein
MVTIPVFAAHRWCDDAGMTLCEAIAALLEDPQGRRLHRSIARDLDPRRRDKPDAATRIR